jgi:hypothetical protein
MRWLRNLWRRLKAWDVRNRGAPPPYALLGSETPKPTVPPVRKMYDGERPY